MNSDSAALVTKCARPSCSKISRMAEDEASNPILSRLRSAPAHEVSSPRGFCFGDRWYCCVECLEWGMGQEVLQLFRESREQAVVTRPRIGTILLAKKWITLDQLRVALEQQRQNGGKLGYWLVELGHVSEERLISALSEQLKLPWMEDVQKDLNEEIVSAFPKTLCYRCNVVPLDWKSDSELTLGVDYGFSDEMVKAVEEVTSCAVHPFLTKREVLQNLIQEHFETRPDDSTEVVGIDRTFASEVGHRFVERWFDFEAEKARFGLFEDTLWVRYLKGEKRQDHFMFFGSAAPGESKETSVS